MVALPRPWRRSPPDAKQPDAKHYVAGREAPDLPDRAGAGRQLSSPRRVELRRVDLTVRVTPTEGGVTDLGTVYAVLDGLIWR